MKKAKVFNGIACALAGLILASCGGAASSVDTAETPETITVDPPEEFLSDCTTPKEVSSDGDAIETDSDATSLDCQIDYLDESLSLETDAGVSSSVSLALTRPSAPARLESSDSSSLGGLLTLRLLATIAAPTVDGNPLGATDVILKDDRAIVTYNTAGEPYLGAIQIVDVSSPTRPRLLSQTYFKNTDISTGVIKDKNIYLAAAQSVDVTGYDAPAEILKLEVDDFYVSDSISGPEPLTSYVGTDAVLAEDALFVTTGSTGGLLKIDPDTLAEKDLLELDDARSVAYDEDDKTLYVFQGTPGRVTAVNPDDLSSETFELGGATIAESKGTIEVSDGLLFVGDGDGGALIVDPDSGEILSTIDNPLSDTLSPELTVANAVSVEDDILFVSNGEAGIRVASWDQAKDSSVTTDVIGTLAFRESISANGITYDEDYLLVAAGTGGLYIVKVLDSPYLGSIDCSTATAALFCDDFADKDGTQINDDKIWLGTPGTIGAVASVISGGARLNGYQYISTVSTFNAKESGKHYSSKMYKSHSGTVMVKNNKDATHGIKVSYDGEKTVTAYIGEVDNAKKRKLINFTLPDWVTSFTAHIYQQEKKVKVALELNDGNIMAPDVFETTDSKLLEDMVLSLAAYDKNDQSKEAPSFDDAIVEDYSF